MQGRFNRGDKCTICLTVPTNMFFPHRHPTAFSGRFSVNNKSIQKSVAFVVTAGREGRASDFRPCALDLLQHSPIGPPLMFFSW